MNTAPEPLEPNANPIDGRVRIGHVHMKASDLKRIEAFYIEILGFSVMSRYPNAVFIAAGSYHHHLAFNTWTSKGGEEPDITNTGLYHIAILYPTKKSLGDALKRLTEANYPVDGISDHGTQLALYLRDPEGNGVELYWDRPESEWPLNAEGNIEFDNKLFNLNDLFN